MASISRFDIRSSLAFALILSGTIVATPGCEGDDPCSFPPDDSNPCRYKRCDEGPPAVVVSAPRGTPCANVIHDGVCDGFGNCIEDVFACTPPPDDGNPCTSETCWEGSPMRVPALPGTPCPTFDACGFPEVCNGSGSCVPSDLCECASAVDGTPCDNGDACTPLGACQAGVCVTPPPIVCSNAGEACLQGVSCGKTCASPLGRVISTSQTADSIVAADFDGDGTIDLATAGLGGIHLRNGASFDNDNHVVMTAYSGSVVTADINGDGKLDLVFTSMPPGTMAVDLVTKLNQGDGTFGPSVLHSTSFGWSSIAAADFNGDSKADLATAINGGLLSVRINEGNGLFAPEVDYPQTGATTVVVTEDLNGDGKIDIVAASSMLNKIVLLFNDGNGAFGNAVDVALTNSPVFIVIADFNGDGKPDLAVAHDGISVFLNDGTGAFTLASEFAAGLGPVSIIAADLNGDGAPDLATTNTSPRSMTTLLNTGNGTFGAPNFFVAGKRPVDIVAVDVDGDAKPDVACVDADEATLRFVFNSCMQ